MSDTPLITVIIPAFNAATYIAQCIENVKFQTYKDIEILVVDDGSTDETVEIANSFNVKVISQSNRGVSAARNTGISGAAGQYLHFLDVDDLINHCFYEELINSACKYDADVVCCSIYHEKSSIWSHERNGIFVASNAEDKMMLAKVGEDGHCFKYLLRKDFLVSHSIYFDEKIRIGEDLVFSIQAVYLANRLVLQDKSLYFYKHRAGSALALFNQSNRVDRNKGLAPVREFKQSFQKKFKVYNLGEDTGVNALYFILGLPIGRKKKLKNGLVKWYFCGICVMRKKNI
ncbi:glycosyltransferase family 2 protein [Sphingobacterium corticibacter]|uniref:Glycosyltransferase 2-like domain-containing protein n=1 Tax=Sphingobacterium corticibacter TaxID=2171749 RepID=A0A2T8HJQ7_9SPHI|nr:glycosyltransferase [Sphingobacterium corticibacter]PVH25635.1 hypothetical protein DC487_06740 [Sphingobacterium corticibacter]